MVHWHRLFGMLLTDFFVDSPFDVLLELDLSIKVQLLDVVVLRRRQGEFAGELPDGFEDLADHNLITYKSFREPLDDWAIDELVGHYVNYRKQVSPSPNHLLPPSAFQLYAVCARFPAKLRSQVPLVRLKTGVYAATWGTHQVKTLVLREMAEEARNAIWELFSGVPAKAAAGATHFRRRSPDTSTLINLLFDFYRLEGIAMPYTMEDFRRDAKRHMLGSMSPEELLSYVPPEERLRGLQPEERLRGLQPEERLRGLPLDERLRGFSPDEIRAYLERLEQQRSEDDEKS